MSQLLSAEQMAHVPPRQMAPQVRRKTVPLLVRQGLWCAGGALLVVLYLLSNKPVTFLQMAIAAVLLFATVHQYLQWLEANQIKMPSWPLVCALHFVYYGLPIFAAARISPSRYDHRAEIPASVLTTAMALGVLGLLCMYLGRQIAFKSELANRIQLPLLDRRVTPPWRVRLLLLVGTAVNLIGLPFYQTQLWNLSVTVFSVLPLIALLWLVMTATRQKVGEGDLILGGAFFVSRLFNGATAGASLVTIIIPPMLVGLAAMAVQRNLPWKAIAAAVLLILFLQPSKAKIRREISRGELTGNALVAWVETAFTGWEEVLSGESSASTSVQGVASRTSLLTLTAVILDKTPEAVPYKYGQYYPLLFANLIPRVLWPDKPTMNLANQRFQVDYGITTERSLTDVSIASGFESEGYMNFGWAGVIGISLFIGIIFGLYEQVCFSHSASVATVAVGLGLLPMFWNIEHQLVGYVGGVVQVLVAAMVTFYQLKQRNLAAPAFRPALNG